MYVFSYFHLEGKTLKHNKNKTKQKKIILNPNHNILQSEAVNRKCSAAAELSALLQQL